MFVLAVLTVSRNPKKLINVIFVAENGLSFIETSALDASNVESAFQNILTGMFNSFFRASFSVSKFNFLQKYTVSYRTRPWSQLTTQSNPAGANLLASNPVPTPQLMRRVGTAAELLDFLAVHNLL